MRTIRPNDVYVTRLDHEMARESFGRLFEKFKSSLPQDCRTISIKVNLCDYRRAASGATTDPVLLDALLEVLKVRYPRGEVSILENDATAVEAHSLFSILGIKQIADKHGARLFNVSEGDWVLKQIPRGRVFKELEVPEILERSDLFINFPKLKTNALTKTTGNLKNIFAFLRTKHKSVYHPQIDDVLVDMNQVIHPNLCIVDGYIGMEGQGPAFGRPKKCGLLIGGVDPVAVDACSARVMGFNPWFIDHIRGCHRVGVGNIRFNLDTDIPDFDFNKYRFDYSRIEHFAKTFLRKRVGVSG
jgi:uncharacterized protein (DUF362 family)